MKVATKQRPYSIKLFAVLCVLSAFISLFRGLLDPFMAQGTLWAYTGMMLGEDAVIIALFSLFTIALIPVFWIYFVASHLARWVVVFFTLISLWLFIINPAYAVTAFLNGPMELAAPALKIISISLLFTSSSNRYFARSEECDAPVV